MRESYTGRNRSLSRSRRVHQTCAKNSPGFSAAVIEHLANRARSAAAALLAEDVVFTKSTLPVG
jgi:hypothetical protein